MAPNAMAQLATCAGLLAQFGPCSDLRPLPLGATLCAVLGAVDWAAPAGSSPLRTTWTQGLRFGGPLPPGLAEPGVCSCPQFRLVDVECGAESPLQNQLQSATHFLPQKSKHPTETWAECLLSGRPELYCSVSSQGVRVAGL